MSELDKLKKLAERQKQEKAKIEGKLESLYEDLGEEGFNSLEDAEKDMSVLSSKIKKMKRTFETKLAEFKKKHAHEL